MSRYQNRPSIDQNHLIQQCLKGNRQAQSQLYQLFAPKMFMVCLRYAKSREEAEEILQEGFMKVFEFLHQFKFAGSFEGWIRKIMVNCALQKYRSKPAMHAILSLENVVHEPVASENINALIDSKELLKIIQQLPPVYKMVFNLYVFEGYKHREIAQELGISEGTSKSNLSDARAILQRTIVNKIQSDKEKINCL